MTQPERLVKHLLQTSHNRVFGFVSDAYWQLGLFPEKLFETVKLGAATGKNNSALVDVPADFSRKFRESRGHSFNNLANNLQNDVIQFAGCNLNSSGASGHNVDSFDRRLLGQFVWKSC